MFTEFEIYILGPIIHKRISEDYFGFPLLLIIKFGSTQTARFYE